MKKKSPGKSGQKSRSKRSPDSSALPGQRSAQSPKELDGDRSRRTARKGDRQEGTRQASPKERRYVAGRVAGKSKRKAALDAGYTESMAENAKQKIDDKPAVQALFTQILDTAGVSDRLLAQRIYQGLHAMQTKTATHEGVISDHKNMVDFGERREMTELALKLKGHLIDKAEVRMVRTYEEILEASYDE